MLGGCAAVKEIVTVYKINCFASEDSSEVGESCSLLPWNPKRPGRSGQDDGGRDYALPEGYRVGTDENFSPCILRGEEPCDLMLHNGSPLLVDPEKRRAFLLEPVKKIATYRALCGLSLAELAERLKVAQKDLYAWENLEKHPDPETLERIAASLGCRTDDLK